MPEWIGPLSSDERTALGSCLNGTERVILISVWLRRALNAAQAAGTLSSVWCQVMDEQVTHAIENFQSACRLVFVPMPFPYAQVVKFVITLFVGVTPFAIVDQLGWATPTASFVLALFFWAVEEIGVEIEDPFGRKEDEKGHPQHGRLRPHSSHKLTHFVNLDAVIREIDATTAMMVSHVGGGRQLLLSGSMTDHLSVCATHQ